MDPVIKTKVMHDWDSTRRLQDVSIHTPTSLAHPSHEHVLGNSFFHSGIACSNTSSTSGTSTKRRSKKNMQSTTSFNPNACPQVHIIPKQVFL
jgi:hypothetical protein